MIVRMKVMKQLLLTIDTIDATGSSANEYGTQQVTITIIADGDAPPSFSINDVTRQQMKVMQQRI